MSSIAAVILGRIRDDVATLDDYGSVHGASAIDYGAVLQPADRDWLLQAVDDSKNLDRSMAACRLLRFLKAPECLTALQRVWGREDLRPQDRCSLIWRLLDYENLPLNFHQEVYDWMRCNEGTFVQEFLEYLRPIMKQKTIGPVECCAFQIKSGKQPRSKWWIYVVSAVLVAERDPSEVKAARKLFYDMSVELKDDPFFKKISVAMGERISGLDSRAIV